MTRKIVVILTMLSALFFPWPCTLVLALSDAIFEPLLPLAAGIFLDTLYYAPPGIPFGTLVGCFLSLLAIFVRSKLKASIIGE